MSIYKDLIESVQNGKRFKIDLNKKDLWIGHKQIIDKGVIIDEKYLNEELIEPYDLEDILEYSPILNECCWNVAECLYDKYQHSSPKKISLGNKPYFKALDIEDLYDYDLAYGLDRNVAQIILEAYILLAPMVNWLVWQNENHWFYQSPEEKEFVVLRDWIRKEG
jgi:hypothetical protein